MNRRELRLALVVATIILGIITVTSRASGILGEDEQFARMKASQWKNEFGVQAPIISTNSKGISIWECWAASSQGMSEFAALKFARKLLPKSVRSTPIGNAKRDGSMKIWEIKGGYKIILHKVILPEFVAVLGDGPVIDVEVRDPSWEGNFC